jgi:putative phosphoribosyl transferase
MLRFEDRAAAGRALAVALEAYAAQDPVVVALPRGGVPVAAEVAGALAVPLDVLVVAKVRAPSRPELGIGAIVEDGVACVSSSSCRVLGISDTDVEKAVAIERRELERRVRNYRGGCPRLNLMNRTVILIDDGVVTAGTARAAISAVRARRPRRLVFAVPVAAARTAAKLSDEVDDLVVLEMPEDLTAIGYWYRDFGQVSDEQVCALLGSGADRGRPADLEQP